MQMFGQQPQCLNQLALANPLLKAPVAGLVRRILRRHLGPLCAAAQNPEHAVQHRPRIVPWAATVVLTPRRAQQRFHQSPLFVCQFPTARHLSLRRRLEHPSVAENRLRNVYEMGSRKALSARLPPDANRAFLFAATLSPCRRTVRRRVIPGVRYLIDPAE